MSCCCGFCASSRRWLAVGPPPCALASGEGRMRLVGSIGLDNQLLQEDQLLPVQLCQCGRALAPGDILLRARSRTNARGSTAA